MKYIKTYENYRDGDIDDVVNDIVENLDIEIINYETHPEHFAVLVNDKNSNFQSWMDIWIDGNDVQTEWNQMIYYMDDRNDVIKKKIEENIYSYEIISSEVINYLTSMRIIRQDTEGNWSISKERIFDVLRRLNE